MGIYDFELMVDCGAPSLYNKLSKKKKSRITMGSTFKDRKFDDFSYTDTPEYSGYRDAYVKFLLENKKDIAVYTNLDVINNPELTWKNQQILESAGLEPVPVFHLGCNTKWLEMYLKKYDYIALGGLIPNSTMQLKPILDNMFKEYFLDKQGFPKVKLHGFACTSPELILRYPWYSVDSTTARKLAMFGHIYLQETGNRRRIKTVTVSNRTIKNFWDPEGLFPAELTPTSPKSEQWNLTPKLRERIEKYANSIGCSWEELTSWYMHRMIFNHMYFSDLVQHEVPDWPWNLNTRQAKPGASERMSLYVAGSFSKKEELWFWNELAKRPGTTHALKKRLHSFFYEAQVQFCFKLKREEEEKNSKKQLFKRHK